MYENCVANIRMVMHLENAGLCRTGYVVLMMESKSCGASLVCWDETVWMEQNSQRNENEGGCSMEKPNCE